MNKEQELMQNALNQEKDNNFQGFAFFGHVGNGIGPWVLSQWYPANFEFGGYTFTNAEMAMMSAKAIIFKDEAALEKILVSSSPKEAKSLGRSVKNYDEKIWQERRYSVVLQNTIAKFEQNPELKDFLLTTGDRTLIEASPYDGIWGVKLPPTHVNVFKPSKWKGLNLLGFALTEAKTYFK